MQVSLERRSYAARPVALARQRGASLGMYPGSKCYDPTRAELLPYWLDNWTESLCKYGNDSAAADIAAAQAATSGIIQAETGASGPAGGGASDAEIIRQAAIAKAAGAAAAPKCTGWNTFDVVSQTCSFDPSSKSFVFLVVAGVAAITAIAILKK